MRIFQKHLIYENQHLPIILKKYLQKLKGSTKRHVVTTLRKCIFKNGSKFFYLKNTCYTVATCMLTANMNLLLLTTMLVPRLINQPLLAFHSINLLLHML